MKRLIRYIKTVFVLTLLIAALQACNLPTGESDEDNEEGFEQSEMTEGIDLEQEGTPITGCEGAQSDWITHFEVLQTPDTAEPHVRVPFRDSVFGTCLVRVTDRNSDLNPEDPAGGVKNEYSRVQSFNADGRFLIARSTEAYWYLYDSSTLQPLGTLPLEDEPRWSATDPYIIYFTSETRMMSYDIQTGRISTVRDFQEDLSSEVVAVWTRHEGSPSADGRYWGFMAQDQDWLLSAYLIYDQQQDQVVAIRDMSHLPTTSRETDSVTISPSGQYFLSFMDLYCEPGTLGSDSNPCGLMVYDQNLENGRSLLRLVGHSDLAFDADGREVMIYQDIDTDTISMLDLESGSITPLFAIDFSHSPIGLHFSGRAFDTPGWALVSTYSGGYPQDYTWMDDSIFAVELKAGGRVIRLAHSQSLVNEEQEHDYWAEPQASVNQDFTRVLFTSNWGRSGTDEVDMYMLYLPEGWLSQLP